MMTGWTKTMVRCKNILSVCLALFVKVGTFDEFVGYRKALNALIEGFFREILD